MRKRREAHSAALSFMDCICCGFGAVLLLFILTAKKQLIQLDANAAQAQAAGLALNAAVSAAQSELNSLEPVAAQSSANQSISLAELQAEQAHLDQQIASRRSSLDGLANTAPQPASQRPSADQNYLSGLRLRGPRAVILLESSGSMLAENANTALKMIQDKAQASSDKWARAKAALRAVIAAIPKETQVAVFQMGPVTTALSGTPQSPYIDPYDPPALLVLLERIEQLKASGGANLSAALSRLKQLKNRPSSVLLIGDGLPTAPAPASSHLSEIDRVQLFQNAIPLRPNAPFNTILLPFSGDPSAAGLFWQLSAQTDGVTLIPHQDWPAASSQSNTATRTPPAQPI